VVDWSFEEDSGWGIRVVVRKVKGKLENEACIWCIGGTCDSRSPGKKIVRIVWEGGDTWCGGHHELHQFCLEAVETKSVTAPVAHFVEALPLGHALGIIAASGGRQL